MKLHYILLAGSCFTSIGRAKISETHGANNVQRTTLLTVDLGYGIYQGYTNQTTGLNIWKGIRFAAPPIGKLRWQKPHPPASNRSHVTPATSFGPICPQSLPSVPTAVFIPGSEDCLFLNVYAPPNAKGLPVLIWIHGGGYGFGDGTQDMSEIIRDNDGTFVAVTIQYRLGAFGFASSEDVSIKGAVNAGLLDQAYALQWVKTHITKFGGDPSKVTISGESAGGGSVMLHALAYGGTLNTELFSNGIAASPFHPPQYKFNDQVPTSRFNDFATRAGCPPSSPDHFNCLLAADSTILQQANFNVTTSQLYGTWAFLPVIDGSYVQQLPSQQLLANKINGANILVGNNANEGALFAPQNITTEIQLKAFIKTYFNVDDAAVEQLLNAYPSPNIPDSPDTPRFATNGYGPATAINISQVATGHQQRANNIYAEATFICPTYWLSAAFQSSTHHSYKYQYSVPVGLHTDDVPAYFGPANPNQGPDFALAFRRIWGNFIKSSNPSISTEKAASHWPAYTNAAPWMLNLNQTGGTPTTVVTQIGIAATEFEGAGLRNDFALVDAGRWEGGRRARCELWRKIGPMVPI